MPAAARDDVRNFKVLTAKDHRSGVSLNRMRMARKEGVRHDFGLLAGIVDVVQHVRAPAVAAAAEMRMVGGYEQSFSLSFVSGFLVNLSVATSQSFCLLPFFGEEMNPGFSAAFE